MINLLAPDDRRQLAAARTNSLLLRYVIFTLIIVGIVVIELIGVAIFLNIDKARNEATISDNQHKTASFNDVKQQADTFRSNLAIAKYILGKQIPYTDLIIGLAQNLPSGSVLQSLDLDPASFGKPTMITVNTTSYDKAIAIKAALQNAKVDGVPLFSAVSFSSVSNTGNAVTYPYTAIYNVTYSQGVLTP